MCDHHDLVRYNYKAATSWFEYVRPPRSMELQTQYSNLVVLNMRDQHDRITVEWMAAFAGTHMAMYTYRKKQLTPAELAHLAELFWVNA